MHSPLISSWKIHMIDSMHDTALRNMSDKGTLRGGKLPVLDFCISHPNCTQQDIATVLGISAPAVTCALGKLEEDGMICREADSENRRCNRITATEHGIRSAQICRQEIAEINARFFKGFSEAELATLDGFLERIIENDTGEKYTMENIRRFFSGRKEHD